MILMQGIRWRPMGEMNAEQLPMLGNLPCNVRGATQDTIERNTLPHKYTKVGAENFWNRASSLHQTLQLLSKVQANA